MHIRENNAQRFQIDGIDPVKNSLGWQNIGSYGKYGVQMDPTNKEIANRGISGFHGKFGNFIGWIMEKIFHKTISIKGIENDTGKISIFYLNRKSFVKWYQSVNPTDGMDKKQLYKNSSLSEFVENAIENLLSNIAEEQKTIRLNQTERFKREFQHGLNLHTFNTNNNELHDLINLYSNTLSDGYNWSLVTLKLQIMEDTYQKDTTKKDFPNDYMSFQFYLHNCLDDILKIPNEKDRAYALLGLVDYYKQKKEFNVVQDLKTKFPDTNSWDEEFKKLYDERFN